MSVALVSRRALPIFRATARGLPAGASLRFESSAAGAAKKASEAAKDTASKAGQGLSRVTTAAGPMLAGAARGLGGVASSLGKVGGPIGRLFSFIEKHTPFVIYYSRVGMEMAKIVFQAQKMGPPSMSTFQNHFQGLLKSLRNPSALFPASQPSSIVSSARSLSTAQIVTGGVVLAECLGFFTVGEMIGRFKLIGYHGDSGSHH